MPTKRQAKLREKRIASNDGQISVEQIAAYIRVSTEDQAESGLGIAAQIQMVKAQCQIKGWPEPPLYIDPGVSGTIHPEERPEMRKLLDGIRAGTIKVVVVNSLDRIGRSAKNIFYFTELAEKYGVSFVSCKETFDTSTAAGRLCVNVLIMLAEFERDNISERVIAALAEKNKRDGDPGGRIPYGYRRIFETVQRVKGPRSVTVDVVIDEKNAEVVRLIFAMRAMPKDGRRKLGPRKTYAQICSEVKKLAPRGPYGGEWLPARIREILMNEQAYRGGQRGESEYFWPVILQDSSEEQKAG